MIKHYHVGPNSQNTWEIAKVGPRKYYATRLSLPGKDKSIVGEHLSPFTYKRLKDAKTSIDNGEADLTANEVKAKEYIQDMKAFHATISIYQHMVWNGNKAAEIALLKIGELE